MNLPNDETGETLRRLQESGSNLSKPMNVDFFISVPTEEVGNLVAKNLERVDYTCSVEQDDETEEWTCYATKTLVPSYENVASEESYIESVTKRYEDSYLDGFGSYSNAQR